MKDEEEDKSRFALVYVGYSAEAESHGLGPSCVGQEGEQKGSAGARASLQYCHGSIERQGCV